MAKKKSLKGDKNPQPSSEVEIIKQLIKKQELQNVVLKKIIEGTKKSK